MRLLLATAMVFVAGSAMAAEPKTLTTNQFLSGLQAKIDAAEAKIDKKNLPSDLQSRIDQGQTLADNAIKQMMQINPAPNLKLPSTFVIPSPK